MKKSDTAHVRRQMARNHLELFRQENGHFERLLKILNTAGALADRLRQALQEIDRRSSVACELKNARELVEAEIARVVGGADAPAGAPPRYQTNIAAMKASNAKLVEAVQERARDNQLLVCRAVATVQSVINTVGSPKSPASDSDDRAERAAA